MTTTTYLDEAAQLRRMLLDDLRDASETVRDATATADERLGTAVHDFRKALRRIRAVVRMVASGLPKGDRRDIRRALTQARRALGSTRDHAVAIDVLDQLEDEKLREPARQVLDRAAAAALSATEIKQLLAEGAARTGAQIELLEAALPLHIEWRTLVDGVRDTYAEARRARRAAKRSRHAFHIWRRRSKELAIQLELLGRIAGPHVEQVHDRITAATGDLGDAVDLLMARDFVRVHGTGIDAAAVSTLSDALADRLDTEIRTRRRAARDAFRKKPRAIAHKLAKAFRRDVTPVTAAPSPRGEEFALT